MPFRPASRFDHVEYAIRDVLGPARALEKQGHKVLRLNIGDPCRFDFAPPKELHEAFLRHANHAWYGESEGETTLREAVARYENARGVRCGWEDVFITAGVSEAISMLCAALLEPGDNVLIPGPTYPPYVTVPRIFGADSIEYPTRVEDGWAPDVETLARVATPRTKAVVLISPNNPTGAIVPPAKVAEIARFCRERGILLIADEIYGELWFGERARSAAEIVPEGPLVVVSGFSKSWLVPGWRMGYMVFRDPAGDLAGVKEAVLKQARLRLSAPLPMQLALAEVLRPDAPHFADLRARLARRARLVADRVKESPHLELAAPQGAFYAFVKVKDLAGRSDKEWTLGLLEQEKVLAVHGSGFGKAGTGHFRMVVLPDEGTLGEAMERILRYAAKTAR